MAHTAAMNALRLVARLLVIVLAMSVTNAGAQTYTPPRTADGQPDLQGIWQGIGVAYYSIENLELQPIYQQNRQDPSLRGKSIIVDPADGKIPYQPWAAAKAKEIFDNHLEPTAKYLDGAARCMLHGVPRHLYNREFEIFQPQGHVVIFNMAHHTYRAIPLDAGEHITERVKLYMGDSRGRWEGNTLVVDVANNNDQTWLDIVGSFHSDAMRVVERFTPVSPDRISYEAVITDPKVYTRPWKIAMPLERFKDYGGTELWEEACHENNERTIELMLKR